MLQVGYYLGDQRYPQGLECPWHWFLTWYPQDLYPWGPLCHIQTQLLQVLVMVVCSLQSLGLHMGMDSDIGGLAEMCHGYRNVYLGVWSSNQTSSSRGAVGKFSSDVSSLKNWPVLGGDVWWWFIWCCTGKGSSAPLLTGLLSGILECHRWGSLGLTGLSSSELLNTKWWCTGLWHLNLWGECTGCCLAVVSGVVGLKNKFSLTDTWYICGTLLRGVGMLKLSLPLS